MLMSAYPTAHYSDITIPEENYIGKLVPGECPTSVYLVVDEMLESDLMPKHLRVFS